MDILAICLIPVMFFVVFGFVLIVGNVDPLDRNLDLPTTKEVKSSDEGSVLKGVRMDVSFSPVGIFGFGNRYAAVPLRTTLLVMYPKLNRQVTYVDTSINSFIYIHNLAVF